tara:strand:+ start:125 stop:376 length:252 start_codon:yes stop_codon:yes gene_type:complete
MRKLNKHHFKLNIAKGYLKLTQIHSSSNNWRTSIEQINLNAKAIEDYLDLLNAERQIFNEGDSPLFMVNSREVGYNQTEFKNN